MHKNVNGQLTCVYARGDLQFHACQVWGKIPNGSETVQDRNCQNKKKIYKEMTQ